MPATMLVARRTNHLRSSGVITLPGPLVSASWLNDRLGTTGLVICDVRWYLDGRSGEAAYDAGHLPDAVWVNLDAELAGSSSVGPGRHPLPSPERFAEAMMAKGIGDDTVVVAYDDAGGSIASRLWWMLNSIGHQVAVLDGGISAWTGELSIDLPSQPDLVDFTVRPWPLDGVVDVVAVDSIRRRSDRIVLDARSAERIAGEPNLVDARLGHIPGAVSAPWAGNLDPSTGLFLRPEQLWDRFTALGVKPDRPAVCQCGSGITACHNLLALRIAQFDGAQLYPGSWSDWSADPGRPAERSDFPEESRS